MNDQRLIDALNRNAEIVALSAALMVKCDGACGRFATYDGSCFTAPLCDECSLRHRENWAKYGAPEELKQAKRARRLEALLRGGTLL